MSKKKILIIIGLLIAWLLVVNYEKNNTETTNTSFEETIMKQEVCYL